MATKSQIISKAKAMGVQKAGPRDLMGPLGALVTKLNGMVAKARSGGNGRLPPTQLYNQKDIYALGQQVRGLMAQAQNLQDDRYGSKRNIIGNLTDAAMNINKTVGYFNEPGVLAREIGAGINDAAHNVNAALSSLKDVQRRSMSGH